MEQVKIGIFNMYLALLLKKQKQKTSTERLFSRLGVAVCARPIRKPQEVFPLQCDLPPQKPQKPFLH